MKKIIATVLAMVMALALCTTAFAADDTYDVVKASNDTMKDSKTLKTTIAAADYLEKDVALTPNAAVANSDGSGKIEHVASTANKYVKTTSPTINDYAVVAHGKTEILYFVTKVDVVEYSYTAKAFTNFGTSCGQLYKTDAKAEYAEITKGTSEGTVYAISEVATNDVALVDGKIAYLGTAVDESTTLTAGKILKHNWVVTSTKMDGTTVVPTVVECAVCHTKSTAIYKTGKAPAGSKVIALTTPYENYEFVPGGTTPVTPDNGKDSPKTFDAGIAMYVGMALTSVAGSAVIIGKKKEF